MQEIFQALSETISSGKRAAIATVIMSNGSVPRLAGAKMLIREDGSSVGTVGGGGAEQLVREKAPQVISSGEALLLHFDMTGKGAQAKAVCGGKTDIFMEPVLPRDVLYIFGAGHISQYTAALAKTVGFTVVVIDPRPEYNSPDRFPEADSLINEPYEEAFKGISITDRDYIIVVTPGHVLDEQCLQFAVGTPASYIGMIGSKEKTKDVFGRLAAKGISADKMTPVHAPIGLAIGAETPEEIAVSIMAEIIQHKRLGKKT